MKKSTSKIHSHLISKTKHAHFLAQKRQDSITHEIIEEGDEVVFCSVCKSAFMVDSWEYIGRSHCHQPKTLKKVPTLRTLSLDRRKIEKRKKVAFYKKHSGGVLIAVCVLSSVVGMMTMAIDTLTSPAKSISTQGITITEKHYINNGKAYYKAQNYTKAESFYIKALNINPSNTEALHLLEQLENEYLLALEEADRFFKVQNYKDASYWYKRATHYKPNSEYPTKQLSLITQAQAEPPILFTNAKDLNKDLDYSTLKEYPKEWEEFINKDEKLHFWVENLQKTEVLLSYESGLVELRSLEEEKVNENKEQYEFSKPLTDNEEETKLGKLLTTFQGARMPQATFVYGELFLREFEKLSEKEKEEIDNKIFAYESISVISKGNKIYYYTLDTRGARQVNEFSTFHFKDNEKVILGNSGRYFLIQTDKILHLYDTRSKVVMKSLRTNEHQSFIKDARFDTENNQIIAQTAKGESTWKITE
ncbi:tetratricopeptide repeat protein [Bernardetia sp. ABR2-2B]|uniref:tetratricopeptide repeat protein n=1 Tax=Bernardetia sp. ABR2-2B TaxID=3127472 RepID=UPI0030D0DB8E